MNTELIFEWGNFITLVIILFVIMFLILLFLVPIKMAYRRGRSGLFWFLISLISSPFMAMFLLLCLGKTREQEQKDISNYLTRF